MNLIAIGLLALLGATSMNRPDPQPSPDLPGLVFLHNEQGGLRESWKLDGPECCMVNDGVYATVDLDPSLGVSCGLATKGHAFTLAPGLYAVSIVIDGYSVPDSPEQAFVASYQRFSWHLGGDTMNTVEETRPVPHNEQGRVVVVVGHIPAAIINEPGFGVWFEASIANDGVGRVFVDRIGVLAEKVD